jgi:hypothetical protein
LIRNLLKWAGGKSQLLSEIVPRLPSGFVTYYEPFIPLERKTDLLPGRRADQEAD